MMMMIPTQGYLPLNLPMRNASFLMDNLLPPLPRSSPFSSLALYVSRPISLLAICAAVYAGFNYSSRGLGLSLDAPQSPVSSL